MSRLEHCDLSTGTADLAVAARLFECASGRTAELASKLSREAALIGVGLAGGTVAEIKKDPLKATVQLAGTALAGSLIAGMALAEAPVLARTGLIVGAGLTGKWVWDQIDPNSTKNQIRNHDVMEAVTAVWNKSDSATFGKSERLMERDLGSLGLDVTTFAIGGAVAGKLAPQIGSEMSLAYKEIVGSGKQLSTFAAELMPAFNAPKLAPVLAHSAEGSGGAGLVSESPLGDFTFLMAKPRHGRVESRPIDEFDLNPVKESIPENGKLTEKANRTELEFPDGSRIVEDFIGNWWIYEANGKMYRCGLDGDPALPPAEALGGNGFNFGAKGWRERQTAKR
jgi:hypothetical protein